MRWFVITLVIAMLIGFDIVFDLMDNDVEAVEEWEIEFIPLDNFTIVTVELVETEDLSKSLFNETPDRIKHAFQEYYLNITEITYYNVSCLNYWFGCVKGMYDFATDKIQIAYLNEEIESVLVHEMGHLLYFKYMNESQRADWLMVYQNSSGITLYGEMDVGEDFAEYYMIIIGFNASHKTHRTIEGNRDKRKEEIIDNVLQEYPMFDLR